MSSDTATFQFSKNWIRHCTNNWQHHLVPLNKQPLTYVEIGVFEGRSACWMLNHVLTHPKSRYIGMDLWQYPPKYDGAVIEQRARSNLSWFGEKATLIRGDSTQTLREPHWARHSIDIGYIDGDHSAAGCLQDSVLLWQLIKPGGIVIWDDYDIRRPVGRVMQAVDAFLNCFAGTFKELFRNRQLGVRKL